MTGPGLRPAEGPRCAMCERPVECCEVCDERACDEALCASCVRRALGVSLDQPHPHGG